MPVYRDARYTGLLFYITDFCMESAKRAESVNPKVFVTQSLWAFS